MSIRARTGGFVGALLLVALAGPGLFIWGVFYYGGPVSPSCACRPSDSLTHFLLHSLCSLLLLLLLLILVLVKALSLSRVSLSHESLSLWHESLSLTSLSLSLSRVSLVRKVRSGSGSGSLSLLLSLFLTFVLNFRLQPEFHVLGG